MLDGAFDRALDGAPGRVSVFLGRPGAPPAYLRAAHERHYAASMMKVAVLVALYRAADAGTIDLDAPVPVHNDFASAAGSRYACDPGYDSEHDVWDRLGDTAPARWLARRMIVRSGNLATNLLLALVGLPAVGEAWRIAGATGSVTGRGIEDRAARAAGIDNTVTAADVARLLGGIATGTVAAGPSCAEMLDVLAAQEHRVDLALGVPGGVRVAHKNGWVTGVRHSAGVVLPGDAPPYVLAVCTTGAPGDEPARRLIARLSRIAWDARRELPA
ncbi:serine hydrolase [Dactylosporangium sp. NPDC049525]|uniref:serine hydrolase n=1 Tax=Dactylosporangium sp. NPDC049525 TaxID=3154730 RepID=UPI00341FB87D